MPVILISPFEVSECRSRLEAAGKTGPIACSIRGDHFTLQKRGARGTSYLRGKFSPGPAGTVLTCFGGANSPGDQPASLWFKTGLPVFLLFAAALFLNGYMNGFTRNLSFGLVLAILVLVAISTMKLGEGLLARREQKELLAFLQATIHGRYQNRP